MPDMPVPQPPQDDTAAFLFSRKRNAFGVGTFDATKAADGPAPGPASRSSMSSADLMTMPKMPELKLQDIPKAPQDQTQDPMRQFGGPAIFLATMGSLLTRHPMRVALNSATAAMQADVQGQRDLAEQHRQQWADATKAAIAQNNVEIDRYHAIMTKYKDDQTQLQSHMMAMAMGFNDPQTIAMLKGGIPFDKIYDMKMDLKKKGDEAQKVIDQHNESVLRQEAMKGGGDVDAEARAIIDLKRAPPPVNSRRPGDLVLWNRVHELKPDYDATEWTRKNMGASSEGRARGAAEIRADSTSLNKLVPQRDAIVAFENTAIKNGRVLKELASKVDSTGIPVIEKWIRGGRQATGDVDVAKFNAQMQLYRAEVAKILTNPNLSGVLSDSARKETEAFLSGAASAKQIIGVIDLLEGDFGRRKEALDESISEVKGRIKGGGKSGPQDLGGGWSVEVH